MELYKDIIGWRKEAAIALKAALAVVTPPRFAFAVPGRITGPHPKRNLPIGCGIDAGIPRATRR
jgi:hypothetical protein